MTTVDPALRSWLADAARVFDSNVTGESVGLLIPGGRFATGEGSSKDRSRPEEVRVQLRRLRDRLEDLPLAATLRSWGACDEIDLGIFSLALITEIADTPSDWGKMLAMMFLDQGERAEARLRIHRFPEHLQTWRCALTSSATRELMPVDSDSGNAFRVVEPVTDLERVALEESTRAALLRYLDRVRTLPTVLQDWGYQVTHTSAVGGVALFHGPPGTGKTFAAGAVARELGIPLLLVDATKLVNKYVGETEQNIVEMFTKADRRKGLLFIDEADSLLGCRTAIERSTDAYRNYKIETLLVQLERRPSPTVLATNLKEVLDPALERRLAAIIEFPRPSRTVRLQLWKLHIPAKAPLDEEIDFDQLAELPLTGGDISQASLTAASVAASRSRGLRTIDLMHAATERVEPSRSIGFVRPASELAPGGVQ